MFGKLKKSWADVGIHCLPKFDSFLISECQNVSKCHVSLVLKVRWTEVDPLGYCFICCCVHFQFLLWRLGKFWAKIWGRGVKDDLSERVFDTFFAFLFILFWRLGICWAKSWGRVARGKDFGQESRRGSWRL